MARGGLLSAPVLTLGARSQGPEGGTPEEGGEVPHDRGTGEHHWVSERGSRTGAGASRQGGPAQRGVVEAGEPTATAGSTTGDGAASFVKFIVEFIVEFVGGRGLRMKQAKTPPSKNNNLFV